MRAEPEKVEQVKAMLGLSDEDAVRALAIWRWPDGEPRCWDCGGASTYRIARGRIGLYRCSDCKHDFSPFSRTSLTFAKGPPQLYLGAIVAFAEPAMNAREFAALAGVNYRTGWRLAGLIRGMAA